MTQYLHKTTLAWLRTLPPGEYTMKQLEAFSGRNRSNIYKILKRLEVPKKLGKPLRANLSEVLYVWQGL